MCTSHWARLPDEHKRAIRRVNVPGQERNYRLVTDEYLIAQAKAVLAMALIDDVPAALLTRQQTWLTTLESRQGITHV